MFNKSLFNKTLFNRILPLFRNKEIISLLGEHIGFLKLEGLFQPVLSFFGIEQLTIEEFGNFFYNINKNGNYQIIYDLNGEFITILENAKAEKVVKLLGKISDAYEEGNGIDEKLLGKLLEVDKDGKN